MFPTFRAHQARNFPLQDASLWGELRLNVLAFGAKPKLWRSDSEVNRLTVVEADAADSRLTAARLDPSARLDGTATMEVHDTLIGWLLKRSSGGPLQRHDVQGRRGGVRR